VAEHAIEAIVSDLDEHGQANLALWGDDQRDEAYFRSELARTRAIIVSIRGKDGSPSSEMQRFRRMR